MKSSAQAFYHILLWLLVHIGLDRNEIIQYQDGYVRLRFVSCLSTTQQNSCSFFKI